MCVCVCVCVCVCGWGWGGLRFSGFLKFAKAPRLWYGFEHDVWKACCRSVFEDLGIWLWDCACCMFKNSSTLLLCVNAYSNSM